MKKAKILEPEKIARWVNLLRILGVVVGIIALILITLLPRL